MRFLIALAVLLVLNAIPSAQAQRSIRQGGFPFARAHQLPHMRARHFVPFFYPPDYWNWFAPDYWDWADMPDGLSVSPMPGLYALPLPPINRKRDEHATVEKTPQGVIIIRGPGSRHIEH